MTIGDMRRLMLKKVVPESVVPQNIVNFLMDENAQPPEPDAFTFLTRLRGLGIGSADFLYLLEGCGAPEAAVEKIRANPAMNLQGLILTLEGSGMTSKDYTRILYTARQIWERTLTLRLQTSTSEQLSEEGGDDTDDYADDRQQASETAQAPAEQMSAAADNTADIAPDDYASDPGDEAEAPLPHGKPAVLYPDATEELMSVDFGSEYSSDDFSDTAAESAVDVDTDNADTSDSDSSAYNTGSSLGIGSAGAADLFGGDDALSGELGYSQSFTESFVNDYMIDFAEDELADSVDDDDYADDFGGSYYGDFEQYTDEIPAVGVSGTLDNAVAERVPESSSSGIPDAREPFEVHIASYDIPEEPDEFERARSASGDSGQQEQTEEFVGENLGENRENVGSASQNVSSEPSADKISADRTDEFEFVTEEELPKKSAVPFEVKIDYGDDYNDEPQTTAAGVQQTASGARQADPQQYNGETTMIVPISREAIEQNISAAAETAAQAADDQPKTAVQKPTAKTARQLSKSEDAEMSDISDDFDREDMSDSEHGSEDGAKKSRIKKGAIIAAGVGAAVLVGANVAVATFIGGQDKNKIAYAESAEQIFAEIYYSHADKIAGADTISEYQIDYSKVFGDLLICGNGLGAFTAGDCVYNVSENKITASTFQSGELTPLGQIEPESGTKFVAAFEAGDSLIAVYSGSIAAYNGGDCGYLRIKGDQAVYTVRQSGKLTDFKIENGVVGIGSVYTPTFSLPTGEDRFGAEDTEVYLPKVGTDAKVIEPQNIVLSKTKGYSYALSASYSLEGGAVSSAKAALGNPVYASVDNRFIMNGSETKKDVTTEYGLMISADGEEVVYERCGKIGCAAAFENGTAALEDGKPILRDKEFKYITELGTTLRIPTKMRFSDNTLVLSDNDGIFLTADCSDLSAVTLQRLTQINGNCDSDSAITLEADTGGIKLTRYVLENGAAKEIVSFTRQLTEEQIKTLVCGTVNAMAVTADRCGAAYSYFDGVSVISEYVTLSDASEAATLFDDKTGFEYAFVAGGRIYAVCSKGAVDVASNDNNNGGGQGDEGQQPENTPSV